jgi:hypothetical protein
MEGSHSTHAQFMILHTVPVQIHTQSVQIFPILHFFILHVPTHFHVQSVQNIPIVHSSCACAHPFSCAVGIEGSDSTHSSWSSIYCSTRPNTYTVCTECSHSTHTVCAHPFSCTVCTEYGHSAWACAYISGRLNPGLVGVTPCSQTGNLGLRRPEMWPSKFIASLYRMSS